MNNSILKTIAAIALLIQIVIPVWWAAVFASFYYFWVEGIIEGGILGAEMVIGVDRAGNSIIGNCFLASPCSFTSLLWGLLSVYSIVAVVVPIYSFFYVKKMGSEQVLTRKGIVFLVINLVTVVAVVMAVSINGGFLPRL